MKGFYCLSNAYKNHKKDATHEIIYQKYRKVYRKVNFKLESNKQFDYLK
jgi:hypothetical protein